MKVQPFDDIVELVARAVSAHKDPMSQAAVHEQLAVAGQQHPSLLAGQAHELTVRTLAEIERSITP